MTTGNCGCAGGQNTCGGNKGKDNFTLSDAERHDIEHAMEHYEDPRAASIDALKTVQASRGWVSDGAIDAIAAVLGIPASDVDGVATFYNRIYRKPVGRHVISVCDSIGCFLTGYEDVKSELQKQLGIEYGRTTADGRVTIMMPHPERVFRSVQNSWRPAAWGEDGGWTRLFRNARAWLG